MKFREIFERYIQPTQPFILGMLLAIVILGGYLAGSLHNTFVSLICGALIAGYFSQRRIDYLNFTINRMSDMSKKSFDAVTDLLKHLQEHADIDIEIATNDPELKDLQTASKMKGGDEDDKIIN